MPTSSGLNDRKGNAALDRSSRTSPCSSARERGPGDRQPTYSIAHGRTVTPAAPHGARTSAGNNSRRVSADEKHALRAQAAQREIPISLPRLVKHGGERDAAHLRHAVGHQVRTATLGARARDLEFSVVGNPQEPHRLAHPLALRSDM